MGRAVVQEVLEAEMDEALQAGKRERTPARLGYRVLAPLAVRPRRLVTKDEFREQV